jgi:hypothetical protein
LRDQFAFVPRSKPEPLIVTLRLVPWYADDGVALVTVGEVGAFVNSGSVNVGRTSSRLEHAPMNRSAADIISINAEMRAAGADMIPR